jgi:hypothetical protein
MFGTLLFGQGPIGISKPIIIGDWLEIIEVASATLDSLAVYSPTLDELLVKSETLSEISLVSICTIPSEMERKNNV